jgi:hypothetical protein
MNVPSTHTFGSAPNGKRSKTTRADRDSDSILEFAEEGAAAGSSKSYAMHSVASSGSEAAAEGRSGIYVTNEMKVDFESKARGT